MKKAIALLAFTAALSASEKSKSFEATYTATLSGIPAGTSELNVWIPLPVTRGAQTVGNVVIDSPYHWTRHKDATFGNEYAFATIANPPAGDLAVRVNFTATRREESLTAPFETAASKADLDRALRADKLVTLTPRIRKLADEITAGKSGTVEQARAIYDYLVTNMTYDKTVPGWGHGDTERACDIKKGNCTDFHSFFMSLARAKGIPARFVIGFPLTAKDGQVKGYHCWAEFWCDKHGWVPVDVSEADKAPERTAEYFGQLTVNRIALTSGRDLVLAPPQHGEPVNFLVRPYVERGGVPLEQGVEHVVTARDL